MINPEDTQFRYIYGTVFHISVDDVTSEYELHGIKIEKKPTLEPGYFYISAFSTKKNKMVIGKICSINDVIIFIPVDNNAVVMDHRTFTALFHG